MAYIDREAFKRKLIDEKGFYPAIVAIALEEMPTADVVEVKGLSPCDVCAYNPPSSTDGKPCFLCPASEKVDGGNK